MFNFDYITKEYTNEYDPNWAEIPDTTKYKILIGLKKQMHCLI